MIVMLVDGGDCLTDLGALRDQPELFGRVCSNSTAARVVWAVGEHELELIREARAGARQRAWALGAAPERIVLDLDASLVTGHSEREQAAPTWKRGFGFHPMLGFLDESREALAGVLRPANAGLKTAIDKLAVVAEALRRIPPERVAQATREDASEAERIIVRCDSAGATHELLDGCREMGLRFSVGFPIEESLGRVILSLKAWPWRAALDSDEGPRKGASIAELPARLIPTGWPQGSRLIVRKERPHAGAQRSFSDLDGHRFQLVLTDQTGDARELERAHRARGDAENRVRQAKDCGMRNLPRPPRHDPHPPKLALERRSDLCLPTA